jgi:hypothetical protein
MLGASIDLGAERLLKDAARGVCQPELAALILIRQAPLIDRLGGMPNFPGCEARLVVDEPLRRFWPECRGDRRW